MILQGEIGTGKTSALIENYINLINSGVSPDKILVLVQNSSKRAQFINKVKEKLDKGAYPKLNIYTFFGLCYNFVLDFWPLVESEIKDPSVYDVPNVHIEPNMCGLEVSQHIFKKCVDMTHFKGYNSKVNLLHQLLRRYSLIVQNALGDSEIEERTKILKESFTQEAKEALRLYKAKTLNLRAFDYLRQTGVFSHLYKVVENPYEYVFLDDGDEITPVCFEYLKHIKPTVKQFFIAHDKFGSSRLGYLSARITDFESFLDEVPEKCIYKNAEAQKLFDYIKAGEAYTPANLDSASFIRRDEMVDGVVKKINKLLKNGVKASDIAIVTPCIDGNLRYFLKNLKARVFFLSGSEKLVQNPYVAGALTFLKIINYGAYSISKLEFRAMCIKTLGMRFFDIPDEPCTDIFQEFIKDVKNLPPSGQLYRICTQFIKNADKGSVAKLNQLIKQIQDFESVFGIEEAKKYIIEQLEHTIISENPLSNEEVPENTVLAGTMQKIIDNEVRAKYHFWLDASSSMWLKQDVGPLYNSWVFQKDWKREDFGVQDNIELTLDKTARILRKLYLCADEKIYVYSSVYDFSGVENFNGINKFFNTGAGVEKKAFKIVPRADQKAVLEYADKGHGKMAVSAVAGSGKTTIMLALIIKLLERGVCAQNIFVLTFMDSAARNFKERIKENFPHLNELPHISTIHGLALRILKENANHTYVALDADFEIVDEARRLSILSEIAFSLELEPSSVELYDRAISTFKNQAGLDIRNVKSPLFKKVFLAYQRMLLENNLIDYDDLLVLSLKVLRENKGVREYYQGLAQFVIEDEAQDSSAIQQELIMLLGEKSGNIIRCGDVNQAITSTFSNSDVRGFKKFITQNPNVTMDCSQRCAKKIYSLANDLIDRAKSLSTDAFLDVKMKPAGGNPVYENELESHIFDTQEDERKFVLTRIQEIFKKNPDATVGILLRSNWGVGDWTSFIEQNEIKTITHTDVLINNPVFELVLAMFNFTADPLDNQNVLKLLKIFKKHKYYGDEEGLDVYISKLNEPFVASESEDSPLWWDLNYFLGRSYLQCEELALEIGDYYFKDASFRPNIILTSLIFAKVNKAAKSFEVMLLKLNDMAYKPNRFGLKFFDTDTTESQKGKVQIMTIHKAKGDEFDFVFVPEFSTDGITLAFENIKLKKNVKFVENLKTLPRTDEEMKQEIAQENYRLLYVAITRAKKSLILSCARKYKIYSKLKDVEPNEFLREISEEVKSGNV